MSTDLLAIFIAGIVAILIGIAWYSSLLFGKIWQTQSNFSDDHKKKRNKFLLGFLSLFLWLFIFAAQIEFIHTHTKEEMDFVHGAFHGLMIGIVYMACPIGILYLQQKKSWKLFFIDALYLLFSFSLGSSILGAFW